MRLRSPGDVISLAAQTEYCVQWKGWPKSANSWVTELDAPEAIAQFERAAVYDQASKRVASHSLSDESKSSRGEHDDDSDNVMKQKKPKQKACPSGKDCIDGACPHLHPCTECLKQLPASAFGFVPAKPSAGCTLQSGSRYKMCVKDRARDMRANRSD